MELQEAINKANQILDQERVHPTVGYERVSRSSDEFTQALASLAGGISLSNERTQRPRRIIEDPTHHRFQSTNYNLLCALLSRVSEEDRAAFIGGIALRIHSGPGCLTKSHAVGFPGWNNLSSDLPLVAEFLARNHGKAFLIRALFEAQLISGHAPLLRQMEELIALNYTVFTDSDYETLASAMVNINWSVARKEAEYRKLSLVERNKVDARSRETGSSETIGLYIEVQSSSKAIAEQCREARYVYVKGSLLEGLNLEVNQDKVAVEQYIQRFGFPRTLVESLNEAERLYTHGTTPLEFKGSMGHLRSFLEKVHSEAIPSLHAKFGGQPPQKWGDGLAYLTRNQILSRTEEQFVSSLYTLISDAGVHPLIAEKEDARLTRNTVIEYALRFFRKVEKLGVKVASAARP